MRITILIIPHKAQRYNTVGDWQFTGDSLIIKVSDTGNYYYNFLIARHEQEEAIFCKRYGISEKEVDEYDFKHPEAGSDSFSDNIDAPYYEAHCNALASEWNMAQLLHLDWKDYTNVVEKLMETYK